MDTRWKAVEARARTVALRPRVLYEIDASDPAAGLRRRSGDVHRRHDRRRRGVNVLAALAPGQQYPRVGAEAVLGADPDLILLGDAPFGQTREVVAARPGWGALRAVQRGAIVEIAHSNITSRPGPRLVDGLELVAKAIHPDVFGPPHEPPEAPAGGLPPPRILLR